MRLLALVLLLLLPVASVELRSTHPDTDLAARFLGAPPEELSSYRARRRLEANNGRFRKSAWLEAVTTLTAEGLSYVVTAEGGSEYVRRRVLHAALEGERDLLQQRVAAALTPANYTLHDDGREGGLGRIRLKPVRKDRLLVDGHLLVAPDTADLIEVQGRLVKTPSFWISRVDVRRRYARVMGVRVPVLTESTASVRFAGSSTFSMTYDYEMVNGLAVVP